MKSLHVKAPDPYPKTEYPTPRVFLAGSIEMGEAAMWQDTVVEAYRFDVVFLNPRRDNWDASLPQSMNEPEIYRQVTWELDAIDAADIVFMYFDPNTKSPITLLELGLCATSNKLIVCCPEGFWRKANVDIVCARHNIPLFTSFDTALIHLGVTLSKHV